MLKLLVLSFFPAFTPPKSGGEQRLFNLYQQLSKECTVTLLSSTHPDEGEQVVYHSANFKERRLGKEGSFHVWWSRLSSAQQDGDISAPCVALSGRQPTAFHIAYLEEYSKADIIIHESPFTVPYDLFLGFDSKPRVYNSYNVESALYAQMHPSSSTSAQMLRDLVWNLEQRLVRSSDLLGVCSDADRILFEERFGRPNGTTLLLPNGFNPSHADTSPRTGLMTAVFLGSGHKPNIVAAKRIAECVAAELPDISFHFIGDCLPAGDYRPNVVRHGRLDANTKARILRGSDFALNPMDIGGGSSLKVLEYFDAGLPLFSTEFGVRGFDAQDGKEYVSVDVTGIAEVIHDWRGRIGQLQEIAAHARALALRKYSWSAIAATYRTGLEALVARGAKHSRGKILALNDYPSFRASGGGGRRTQGLYKQLAMDFSVAFVCLTDSDELVAENRDDGILEILVPKTREHLERQDELNASFHVSVTDIASAGFVLKNPYLKGIYECLRSDAKLIVIEHPYMVRLPSAYADRFVYSSQNHELLLKRHSLEHHPEAKFLLSALADIEDLAVSTSATVVVCSAEDALSFTVGRATAAPILVVPNGAPYPTPPTAVELASARPSDRPVALFIGSAHMPNIESAEFIVTVLAKECPEIDFHLVGSVCGSLPSSLPRNVVAWGTVSDGLKTAIANSSTVAINPMFSGGGSNVKVSDFFANGLHVVSTRFGMRGYPVVAVEAVTFAEASTFSDTLKMVVRSVGLNAPTAKQTRRTIFETVLSDVQMGRRFKEIIHDLVRPKKRVLAVTYRYTWPVLGGAEAHFLELIRGLGQSGSFAVDVVSTEVSAITDTHRFHSTYSWDPDLGAPTEVPNVRYMRFAVEPPRVNERADSPWRVQADFEQRLYEGQFSCSSGGLLWGWHWPERWDGKSVRWGSISVGIYVPAEADIRIVGYAPFPCAILVRDDGEHQLEFQEVDGEFTLEFRGRGVVSLQTSSAAFVGSDPRTLCFVARMIMIDDSPLDLEVPALPVRGDAAEASDVYERLHEAAVKTRFANGTRLTDARGPHSVALEAYMQAALSHYDLILTHNNVFRPAVLAIEEAKKCGIPSILVAQVHLDDDYYHFPDTHASVLDASIALVAPRAAQAFFRKHGKPDVRYHTPGFYAYSSEGDGPNGFDALVPGDKPFLLVLGRKAASKNYSVLIGALRGRSDVRIVMIGPDDDGVPITEEHVVYLGLQPRIVVTEALRKCVALVNMSSSESFGMVLLEAWAAGKPVIANAHCQAFRDIVIDGENGLLVDPRHPSALVTAVDKLCGDEAVSRAMGRCGQEAVDKYAWQRISSEFVSLCRMLVESGKILD